MLVEDKGLYIWLLFVAGNQYDRLLVVVYGIIFTLGGIGLCGDVRESFLDKGFNGVDINIAYHYYTLQVGTVPFFVIVS